MYSKDVFICYRGSSADALSVGAQIYTLLEVSKNVKCFYAPHTIPKGEDFQQILPEVMKNVKVFVLLLTPNFFDGCSKEDDTVFLELKEALANENIKFLPVTFIGFNYHNENLSMFTPEQINRFKHKSAFEYHTAYSFKFAELIQKICELRNSAAGAQTDWKELYVQKAGTYLASRAVIESEIATLENRFGKEFIECVKAGKVFDGEQRIKYIRMSCYAASVIFTPHLDMLDHQAYDHGMMFNIFAQLLRDPDFSLEIVTNAPSSCAVADAVKYEKLGNSSLEACPEAVFFGSYAGVTNLIKTDEVFAAAVKEKRFRFMVTENVPPYALFQIVYKDKWRGYNHIKVDLYSEGLDSSMNRRSMIIFETDDPENYNFFVARHNYIRNARESKALISSHNDEWIAAWEDMKDE